MTDRAREIAALADEYVVGLLSPSEEALFEALLDRDADLSRQVGAMRDRLLPLDLSAPQVPLPADFVVRVHDALPPQDLSPKVTVLRPAQMPAPSLRPVAEGAARLISLDLTPVPPPPRMS